MLAGGTLQVSLQRGAEVRAVEEITMRASERVLDERLGSLRVGDASVELCDLALGQGAPALGSPILGGEQLTDPERRRCNPGAASQWGRAAARLMARRPSNRRRNSWAVSLLDVREDDRVLEIGFGPGLAIRELSRIAADGCVCGIDHSELMLRWARRRNADAVRRGVVDLRLGSVDELPAFDAPFDKILTVNTMLFWSDPDARLAELRRLLRPGGTIAVAHQPRAPGATDATSAAKGREIAAALDRAGFSEVRLRTMASKPAVVCAAGMNGART